MSISLFEKEVLKYEKKGFKVSQRRKLKHGRRLFLKKERTGLFSSGFDALYIYYVDGDCTLDSLRECLRDYAKFHRKWNFDERDKGLFLCKGKLDEKLFKDLRKVMIGDNDIRKSIKPIGLGEVTKGKIESEEHVKRIFIVHGRDKTPALELARFLEKRYPIDAILLEEQAHRGRTLIEKLEQHSDVDFACIILTPDDVGALKGESLRGRGRQNVIFEWGQFIGKIGRKNVCLLIRGDVEIPSDLHGIGQYRFVKNVKECFIDVETELKEAGMI